MSLEGLFHNMYTIFQLGYDADFTRKYCLYLGYPTNFIGFRIFLNSHHRLAKTRTDSKDFLEISLLS